MINIDILKNIIDEKLWQMEETIRALNSINFCRDDFLSYSGPVNDVFKEAENRLRNIFYSKTFRELDENYIALALFLRGKAYWFTSEIADSGKDINCPPNILNGYKMYLDYFCHRTEKQEIIQYNTIEELRENLFEQYKYNRNIKDNNNIKVLKLLTLVNEYKQAINEGIVEEKYFTNKFN